MNDMTHSQLPSDVWESITVHVSQNAENCTDANASVPRVLKRVKACTQI